MFKVHIRVHGHVRTLVGWAASSLQLAAPTPLSRVLELAGVNPELIMSMFVDGQRVERDYILDREAEVDLISPAAGGS